MSGRAKASPKRREPRSRARAAPKPSGPPKELRALQDWMQEAVVGSHEGRAFDADAAARHVLPAKELTPGERVGIYTGMYRLRMLEALEVDYPALRRFLGPDEFSRLMMAYLRSHPSRHYSLNFLGYALPDFLARPTTKVRSRAFLADVARVENAITIVFDEPESTKLAPADVARLPADAWSKVKLELAHATRLLELDHAANAAVTALRNDREPPSTRRKPSWVVVYRKDFVVWRMDLERAAFEVLEALRDRRTLPQAIEAGAAAFDGPLDELQSKVRTWFSEWVAEGLFRAVRR